MTELAIAKLARHDGVVSVLAVDLDRFKALNDRFGHPAGDRALKAVADAMVDVVRDTDIVVRLGGDEFVIVLPDVGEAGVLLAAKRVITALSRIDDSQFGSIHASIGWATGRTDDVAGVLAEADAELYAEKRSRREAASIL